MDAARRPSAPWNLHGYAFFPVYYAPARAAFPGAQFVNIRQHFFNSRVKSVWTPQDIHSFLYVKSTLSTRLSTENGV